MHQGNHLYDNEMQLELAANIVFQRGDLQKHQEPYIQVSEKHENVPNSV